MMRMVLFLLANFVHAKSDEYVKRFESRVPTLYVSNNTYA
jgi:hypothetical protein